jgi:hypothetical protein
MLLHDDVVKPKTNDCNLLATEYVTEWTPYGLVGQTFDSIAPMHVLMIRDQSS